MIGDVLVLANGCRKATSLFSPVVRDSGSVRTSMVVHFFPAFLSRYSTPQAEGTRYYSAANGSGHEFSMTVRSRSWFQPPGPIGESRILT